jgi:hypothetical protein
MAACKRKWSYPRPALDAFLLDAEKVLNGYWSWLSNLFDVFPELFDDTEDEDPLSPLESETPHSPF